jgi:hypothetical protein
VYERLTRNGFVAAGLMNVVGVLFFSRALTNTVIYEADPVVMSKFGLVMIMIWGLAYIGAATITSRTKWLVAAFAIEKLVYVVVWINWLTSNSLAQLYSKDTFAGIFFTIYGANNLLFLIFFVWVFRVQRNAA